MHADPTWLPLVRTALREAPAICGPIVVAASGGADSTALAWALARLRADRQDSFEVCLVHCDHGQHERRREAARAVVDLAEILDCRAQILDLGLRAGASEEKMRDARYAALGAAARTLGASLVATAHHADDQIETIVMRAARGTGARGLAGIPLLRPLVPGTDLVRPLLQVRKEALRALVAGSDLPFVEDPTNSALDRTRNRTRHVVLPRLREADPGVDASILDAGRRVAQEVNRTQATAMEWLAPHLEDGHPTRFDLRALPPEGPVGREILRIVHLALTGEAPLGSWLARVTALTGMRPGTRVDASAARRLSVERTRAGLHFSDPEVTPPAHAVQVPEDGTTVTFGRTAWSVWVLADAPDASTDRFDGGSAPGPYHLRCPRQGDRVDGYPGARGGSRSLRRLLATAGVAGADRRSLPLLCAQDDRIVWAPGLGVAPFARVGAGARRILAVGRRLHRVGIDLRLPAY